MLCKIAVQRYAVHGLPQMHPVRHKVYQSLPLLQKQNVGSHLSPRIRLESVIGQTNRTQQFCSLCDIPTHRRIGLVHRAFRSNERNDAARTHLIQRFRKEIIVD